MKRLVKMKKAHATICDNDVEISSLVYDLIGDDFFIDQQVPSD